MDSDLITVRSHAMSDSDDTIVSETIDLSSGDSWASSTESDADAGLCLFDLLSDEIVLEIIERTDFWSRENLRATCTRFKHMIDAEVRELDIDREWVTQVFRPRRFAYLRCTNKKSRSFLPYEERQNMKEQMITQYITRHPRLKSLYLKSCGMTLLHNSKYFRSDFAAQLAESCPNIEDMLVCGLNGLKIMLAYLNAMKELKLESKLKTLRLNPFRASLMLVSPLMQVLDLCPSLQKIVIFAAEHEGVTMTALMSKGASKMIKFLSTLNKHGLKSLVTCFRTDPDFKTLAIEQLTNMRELIFSGPIGSENEFKFRDEPMTSEHMKKLVGNNPSLKVLKAHLQPDALSHLPELQSLERLVLVSNSGIDSGLKHIFTSNRPSLTVLGLTFLTAEVRGLSPSQFHFCNCPNIQIFAISLERQPNIGIRDILAAVAAGMKELRELYYSNGAAESLNNPEIDQSLSRVFISCRSVRRLYLNNNLYVRSEEGIVFSRGLVHDPRRRMEQSLFS